MPLQQYDANKLISTPIDINLSNISLKQNQTLFNGGYRFNFSEILTDVRDIKNKNYTNFYLTNKNKLSEYLEQTQLTLEPTTILSPIKSGDSFVTIEVLSGSNFINYDYYFNLKVTNEPIYNQYFTITFVNDEYCTIGYTDDISNYFLVIENNLPILKKGINYTNTFNITGAQFFKYILNEDKIFFLKTLGAQTHQLASVNGVLSSVNVSNISPDTFRDNSFTISNNINLSIKDKVSTDYITYNNDDLTINLSESLTNLSNNFILYRNLDKTSVNRANLILLKNQMTDNDILSKSNNLSYYNDDLSVDLRDYTSIFNDIDTEIDEGLEVNYVTYNKSIDIKPGKNFFITEKSFVPFEHININDTRLAESGAFPFTNPIYSDKVYRAEKLNDDTEKVYLCTWLSGSPYSNNSVWVDRYYYPDYITKRQALSSTQAFNTTYNSYIETLITSNSSLSSNILQNYTFDKKSDMLFTPNTGYIYDRFDFDSLNFDNRNIYGTNLDNYYTDINSNGGFTLRCTLVCNQNRELNVISTEYKGIQGGVNLSYNDTTLFVRVALYNQKTSNYDTISAEVGLKVNVDNNIILNVDSNRGIVQLFVNGSLKMLNTFPVLNYKLLYGNFYAGSEPLLTATSFVNNVLLTTSPLSPDEVNILNIKDTSNYTQRFSISLPCGMRNVTDSIAQINSITTNQKSKSNSIDLHISNLGITDDDTLNSIKNAINNNISELIPVNTNINQINILS